MTRGRVLRLVLTALLPMAATQSGLRMAFGQQSSGPEDDGVIFTWGDNGEPDSLNPMSGYLGLDGYFWAAQYHLLIDFDEDLGAEPGLATKVETSDDHMTFTYTIRDDVVWSDGVPLTADDVAYTLNLYRDNHAYLPQAYLTLIDGKVRVLDDTHIQFNTLGPTGLYSGEVPYMYDYILPRHVFEPIERGVCPDGEDPCTPKGYDNVPSVGSGPFTIAEYKVGQYVRMERNPEWTGPDPHVDEIVYRIYKNDDALALALQQGEIDFAYIDTPNVFKSLMRQPDIKTAVGSLPSFSEIGMNTGSAYQKEGDGFEPHGDGHPALTDATVRQAIRMAINSQELVEKVLLGYGAPGDTIIPPVSLRGARWVPEGAERLSWDLEGAQQLLQDAGYIDTDQDGVREMPAGSLEPGRPLDFRYDVRTTDQPSIDASAFVSEWLRQIGIETEVTAVTSARLGDLISQGDYDLFSWGWTTTVDPDTALSWFQCSQRSLNPNSLGNNDAYYCNPEYDRLYLEQQQTLNKDARWDIVHEMQRIYYEDSAYAVLWYDPYFQAYRADRFTGYNPQPRPNGDLLEGFGGVSAVWLTLRPISSGAAEGGNSGEAKGIPAVAWATIAIVAIAAAVFIVRRRRAGDSDDKA